MYVYIPLQPFTFDLFIVYLSALFKTREQRTMALTVCFGLVRSSSRYNFFLFFFIRLYPFLSFNALFIGTRLSSAASVVVTELYIHFPSFAPLLCFRLSNSRRRKFARALRPRAGGLFFCVRPALFFFHRNFHTYKHGNTRKKKWRSARYAASIWKLRQTKEKGYQKKKNEENCRQTCFTVRLNTTT